MERTDPFSLIIQFQLNYNCCTEEKHLNFLAMYVNFNFHDDKL